MKKVKYIQRYNDEGFAIRNREMFLLRCCDCGLVHKMVVSSLKQRRGSIIGIAATRDNRRTAASRRAKCSFHS